MNTVLNVLFNLYISSTFLALASVILWNSKFRRIVEIYELEDMQLDLMGYLLALVMTFVPILNFVVGMKYFQIGVLYTDAEFVRGLFASMDEGDDNNGQGN